MKHSKWTPELTFNEDLSDGSIYARKPGEASGCRLALHDPLDYEFAEQRIDELISRANAAPELLRQRDELMKVLDVLISALTAMRASKSPIYLPPASYETKARAALTKIKGNSK